MSHEKVFQDGTPTIFGLWGAVAAIFKMNGGHEFSMSHNSANNIDRKLIIVSIYVYVFRVNESKYGNYIVPAIGLQYGCHILCTFITLFNYCSAK